MKNHIKNSPHIQEAFKRSLEHIKLRPKLKAPSKHALPPDEALVAPTEDPTFKKQIMGFREWCENVYDRRDVADRRGDHSNRDIRP